jgi:bifunctional non-homologous end joining protein LigD
VASKKTIGELGILPQLLNFVPDAETFIHNDDYLAQEKMDGDRRMLSSDVDFNDVVGLNRKGQKVLLPIPIFKSVGGNYTLDGEIIGDKLFVFDILSLNGDDAKSLKCIERVALLNSDLKLGDSIVIVKTAYTREEKQALYEELIARNAEGIVFKKKNSPYTPGRPASGGNQIKYKFYKTGTFIVKDYTTGKRSVGVELIGEDGVTRVSVGRVTIPPNKDIPAIGDLIEVRYLYAFKGGSIFQPVYLNKRDDLYIDDANVTQLIYKADDEE